MDSAITGNPQHIMVVAIPWKPYPESDNGHKYLQKEKRMHHAKDKGDLGVMKVACSLMEQGFMVLFPQTEHAPFDLVAYKDGIFNRIQVKYRAAKGDKIMINLASSWADQHGNHRSFYGDDVDVFAIYCPTNDMCYYVGSRDENSITLRLSPTRNNQKKGVLMASDFVRVP